MITKNRPGDNAQCTAVDGRLHARVRQQGYSPSATALRPMPIDVLGTEVDVFLTPVFEFEPAGMRVVYASATELTHAASVPF